MTDDLAVLRERQAAAALLYPHAREPFVGPHPINSDAEPFDEAEAFVSSFTGYDDQRATFQTFDDVEARKDDELARVRHGTLDEHRAWLDRMNAKRAGVFLTINETDLRGRKGENVTRVRAVFFDDDQRAIDPTTLPIEPSVYVTTRNGGHGYFLVDDCPLDAFTAAQKQLAAVLGTDTSICDRNRVMRIPGFDHHKGEPFRVRLTHCSRKRYQLAEVLAAFPLPEPETVVMWTQSTSSDRVHSSDALRRWAQACLYDEAKQLAGAANGTRNPELTRVAWKCGQCVPLISESEITEVLTLACIGNGSWATEQRKCIDTMQRQIADGARHPRRPT
jgi:hypothetical protein